MSKKIEKFILKWIFPLMIIFSFLPYNRFNYYFLFFVGIAYFLRHFSFGIIINLSYIIVSIITNSDPITIINLLLIIILIYINQNIPYLRVFSYLFGMGIFISFMGSLNFYLSILTIIFIILFSYFKEKRKIFLYLLIPVLVFSFFNNNYSLINRFEKQSSQPQKIIKDDINISQNKIMEKKNNQNENNMNNQKNIQNNINNQQSQNISIQAPGDILILQSIILILALFMLLYVFIYQKFYDSKKIWFFFSIFMIFLIIGISGLFMINTNELKPYSQEDQKGLTSEKISNNLLYRAFINPQDYENMSQDERIATLKTFINMSRVFLTVTIIFLIVSIFFLIKIKGRSELPKKKTKKQVQKEKDKIYDKKGIYLLDEGYKFIRRSFYPEYYFLTPYELINNIPVSSEFKKLTELFVKKEYGTKNIDFSDKEIKNLIDLIIDNLENNS